MPTLTPRTIYSEYFTAYNNLVHPLNWPFFQDEGPETDADAITSFIEHIYDLLEHGAPPQFGPLPLDHPDYQTHRNHLNDWARMIWEEEGVGQQLLRDNIPTLDWRESSELYTIMIKMAFISVLYQIRERLIKNKGPIPVPSYLTDDKLAQQLAILQKRIKTLFIRIENILSGRVFRYSLDQKILFVAGTFQCFPPLLLGILFSVMSYVVQQNIDKMARKLGEQWSYFALGILVFITTLGFSMGTYMLYRDLDDIKNLRRNLSIIRQEQSELYVGLNTLDTQRDLFLALPTGMPEIKLAATKISAPPPISATHTLHAS